MKRRIFKPIVALVVLSLFLVASNLEASKIVKKEANENRIVSLDGSITEILFALGVGDQVVGRDVTSYFPSPVKKLPVVGHGHHFSAESILSLKPSLVFIPENVRSKEVLDQLQNSKIKIVKINSEPSVAGAKTKIKQIAQAVQRPKQASQLIAELEKDLIKLDQKLAKRNHQEAPKAAFLYLRGPQSTFICGKGSRPFGMMELVKAGNAVPKINRCKPLSAEALSFARPEVLVVFRDGLKSVGGLDGLMKLPGVKLTPAGKAKRFVVLDDLYMSSFGPRMGRAALDLYKGIYESKGVFMGEPS